MDTRLVCSLICAHNRHTRYHEIFLSPSYRRWQEWNAFLVRYFSHRLLQNFQRSQRNLSLSGESESRQRVRHACVKNWYTQAHCASFMHDTETHTIMAKTESRQIWISSLYFFQRYINFVTISMLSLNCTWSRVHTFMRVHFCLRFNEMCVCAIVCWFDSIFESPRERVGLSWAFHKPHKTLSPWLLCVSFGLICITFRTIDFDKTAAAFAEICFSFFFRTFFLFHHRLAAFYLHCTAVPVHTMCTHIVLIARTIITSNAGISSIFGAHGLNDNATNNHLLASLWFDKMFSNA